MKNYPRVTDPFGDPDDGHVLTRAIIDTIREPLIVLDENLRIIVASKSFYTTFNLTHENTHGKMFYDLGNGQWNIPALRTLLEQIIPTHTTIEEYEITHNFLLLGARTMVINAREIHYENGRKKMLLSICDVTEERLVGRDRENLIIQKDLLLKEMRHRIANSLQIIASILLLKAHAVTSEETRAHLEDAHERIISIATIQQQLDPVGHGEEIAVAGYLVALCKSLTRSMIGTKPITLSVTASSGSVLSDTAVSLGLITTELVINALKHAFMEGQSGEIIVMYDIHPTGWTLSVTDNGVGETLEKQTTPRGLGTSLIDALVHQLHAVIRTESTPQGTKVSITAANTIQN